MENKAKKKAPTQAEKTREAVLKYLEAHSFSVESPLVWEVRDDLKCPQFIVRTAIDWLVSRRILERAGDLLMADDTVSSKKRKKK